MVRPAPHSANTTRAALGQSDADAGWTRIRGATLRAYASGAFTVLELLTVIVMVGILSGLLLPVLAKARARSSRISCVNNLHQLSLGWLAYAEDNQDVLAPNFSRSLNLIQASVAGSWVLGNARWDRSTTNLATGCLFGYVGRNDRIYHCPSDKSVTAGALSKLPRTRSYALDSWLNGDIQGKGWGASPRTASLFKTSLHQLSKPVQVFTFLDEHPDSIDDGFFAIHDPVHWNEPNATLELKSWMELPADRHERGCNLSFADGHADTWRWNVPKIFREYEQRPASDPDKADLQRLQSMLP